MRPQTTCKRADCLLIVGPLLMIATTDSESLSPGSNPGPAAPLNIPSLQVECGEGAGELQSVSTPSAATVQQRSGGRSSRSVSNRFLAPSSSFGLELGRFFRARGLPSRGEAT